MTDKPTIVFLVRGIAGEPSDFCEWEQSAADWVNVHTPFKARAISYKTSFLTVWFRRRWRSRRFSYILRQYTTQGWRVVIIAHSEGTVVALDSMRLAGWPHVEAVHLVCGACDSDFHRNGLNFALRIGAIGQLHCCMAGEDHAMWYEDLILGKLLFGIPERSRPLGLNGPRNISPDVMLKVAEHREPPWDNYGHSTCFEKRNFPGTIRTMLSYTGNTPFDISA